MKKKSKSPIWGENLLIVLMGIGILASFSLISRLGAQKTEAEVIIGEELEGKLALVQRNSLLPISDPSGPEFQVVRKIPVIITAYSSSPWETDSNPYLTAAGTQVKKGVVANNLLPFGTKIRIPEIYGDKIFVVEDRMNWKKGYYQVDIWFPSYWEAKSFGAKRTYIEILES